MSDCSEGCDGADERMLGPGNRYTTQLGRLCLSHGRGPSGCRGRRTGFRPSNSRVRAARQRCGQRNTATEPVHTHRTQHDTEPLLAQQRRPALLSLELVTMG